MASKKEELVEIRPLDLRTMTVRLVGDSPIIFHNWSEKAKKEMLAAQKGEKAGKKRNPKNEWEDFIESMYWLTPKPKEYTEAAYQAAIQAGARFGFPAVAFKSAAISAAYREGWSKNMVSIRSALFVESDAAGLVEVVGDPPIMREDMVRVGMGTADLRYRGEMANWHVDLKIRHNASGVYSLDNVINMLNLGGFACGVGEWRTEKSGTYGAFHVDEDFLAEELKKLEE